MALRLSACAVILIAFASVASGAPHRKTDVDIYEDFIAARAAASACLRPSAIGDRIYADKSRRVAARTGSLILAQNPTLSRPQVEARMAAASKGVRETVLSEVKAKSCASPRIAPLLDFYKQESIRRW